MATHAAETRSGSEPRSVAPDTLALNLLEDDEIEGDTVERLRRALDDHERNEDDGP